MRKISILLMIGIFIIFFTNVSMGATDNSSDYLSFAYINCTNGKLLRDYTEKEIKDELVDVMRVKFTGWAIKKMVQNVHCSFISHTVFSVYNDGNTPITYSVRVKSQETIKTQSSITGNIGYKLKNGAKKFSHDFDAACKVEYVTSYTSLVEQDENMDVEVDPQTICVIYVEGTGLVTNGVAVRYSIFRPVEIGSFEFFTITNSYLRIEKIKI